MAPGEQRGARLTVLVADERGRRVAAPALARWLARVAPARTRGIVSVALVTDARIRALNCQYRRRDYATDVLSFPAAANSAHRAHRAHSAHRAHIANPAHPANPAHSANPFLGDIVIARGVARRQALAAGHDELTELRVLALHGLLHLLGYDHERDDGRMHRTEVRLRRKGGLREGLIERATGSLPVTREAESLRSRPGGKKRGGRSGVGPREPKR